MKIRTSAAALFLGAFLFLPVFSAQAQGTVTEKIVYAVNEDYAAYNPNWRTAAQDEIDYTNQVLAQNTDKRYSIAAFKTFDVKDWNQLGTNPEYVYDNGYGGTTVFHWVDMPDNPIKPSGLLVNVTSSNLINSVRYQQLFLVESHVESTALRGKSADNFESWMQSFLHELGHSMGLGVPDWYFYDLSDLTGVEPRLPDFSLRTKYPNDPMSEGSPDLPQHYRYTDLNAAIINSNLRHEKSFTEIQNIVSTQVKVTVKDASGQPVPGATVQVFGGKKGCYYCHEVTQDPLLETVATDSAGEATIAAPSVQWAMNESPTTQYIGLVVKASKGDLKGGDYVVGQEMQENKFLTGNDTYPLAITIDSDYVGKEVQRQQQITDDKGIKIVNLRTADITDTQAKIEWETTYEATSMYRVALPGQSVDSQMWTVLYFNVGGENKTHVAALFNLAPNTRYPYQVKNRATGTTDTWVQASGEFTTLSTSAAAVTPTVVTPAPTTSSPPPIQTPSVVNPPVTVSTPKTLVIADYDERSLKSEPYLMNIVLSRERARAVRTDKKLVSRLKGRILLQVGEKGEAWWVDPVTSTRRYLGQASDLLALMRARGLGISAANLRKIPVAVTGLTGVDTDGDGLPDTMENALGTSLTSADSDGDGYSDFTEVLNGYDPLGKPKLKVDVALVNRLKGRILLQVEGRGEAWYLNPTDGKRYFLGQSPADALAVLRALGLGVSNADLNKIPVAK